MPATQIKVSGCSGMALAHSRGTSCAAPRCVPRITVVVIRSVPNAAMSQARTSWMYFRQFLVFYTPQGSTEKSGSLSGVRH